MTDDPVARLRLEAQCHAQEARTANATINEIYQIVSGGRGEPGNWHGAEPVRRYVEAAEARVRELEAEVSGVSAAIGTTRFMDPPDGGSVTLSEQVARLRQALDAAEGRLSTIRSETIERCAKVVTATVTGIEWQRFITNGVVCMDSKSNDLFLGKSDIERLLNDRATAIRQLAQVKHEAE